MDKVRWLAIFNKKFKLDETAYVVKIRIFINLKPDILMAPSLLDLLQLPNIPIDAERLPHGPAQSFLIFQLKLVIHHFLFELDSKSESIVPFLVV